MNRGTIVVARPSITARVFMINIADMAARKTVYRECLIAIMAAMKKVLSPSSETMITDKEATNPCKKVFSFSCFQRPGPSLPDPASTSAIAVETILVVQSVLVVEKVVVVEYY